MFESRELLNPKYAFTKDRDTKRESLKKERTENQPDHRLCASVQARDRSRSLKSLDP